VQSRPNFIGASLSTVHVVRCTWLRIEHQFADRRSSGGPSRTSTISAVYDYCFPSPLYVSAHVPACWGHRLGPLLPEQHTPARRGGLSACALLQGPLPGPLAARAAQQQLRWLISSGAEQLRSAQQLSSSSSSSSSSSAAIAAAVRQLCSSRAAAVLQPFSSAAVQQLWACLKLVQEF
jgi:hypothetical protein